MASQHLINLGIDEVEIVLKALKYMKTSASSDAEDEPGKLGLDLLSKVIAKVQLQTESKDLRRTPGLPIQRYLDVSFSNKEKAKALGARWDATKEMWYVPYGFDLFIFKDFWLKEDKDNFASACGGSGKIDSSKVKRQESKRNNPNKSNKPKVAKQPVTQANTNHTRKSFALIKNDKSTPDLSLPWD